MVSWPVSERSSSLHPTQQLLLPDHCLPGNARFILLLEHGNNPGLQGGVGGLCRLALGCVHAVINITQHTDTRCARGRLERILNCTKMEFLGNFQGVLRAGTGGRAEIYTDRQEKRILWGYGTGHNPWASYNAMG